MKKPVVFNGLRWAAIISLLMIGSAYPQARNCDFWGTAKYRGVNVSGSDAITAYDAGGQLCGTAYSVGGGYYAVHVVGDIPGADPDEGAPENGPITLKINNETANVVSGSNVWTNSGSYECNIEVPDVPPTANPGGPYSGSEGSNVSFNGSGSTGAVSYSWNFGDTQTGTGVSPTHAYVQQGTYTVSLTVSNNSGQTDTKTTTANIANVPPTVSASSNAPKNEGSEVQFNGSATDPGSQDVLTYSWNFGDNTSSSQQNPTHTYADNAPGSNPYTVTLTVNDGVGNGSKQISVMINNVAPTAEAGPNQTVNEGQTVSFSGSATDPGTVDRSSLNFNWNFGDGQSGAGAAKTHLFTSNGPHTIILTVTDKDGGSDTDDLTVTVNNLPPTANAGGPYFGVVNYPVQFHGVGTDPGGASDVLTYTWDINGDGVYGDLTGQDPTHTYTSIGTRTVSLKVTDEDGASATNSATVDVGTGVPVTFATNPAGMQLKIDEVTVTTPVTYYYVNGTTHKVEAPYTQNEAGGYRSVFTNWSDGGQMTHNISVGTTPATYTASYKIQYFLQLDDGGKNAHPRTKGFYDPNTRVEISVDSLAMDPSGTARYRFLRWNSRDDGGYSGSQRTVTITMKAPINEEVIWSASEYYIQVESPYGVVQGSGWYEAGSTATVSVDTSVSTGPGKRQAFIQWHGQGNGSYTGTLNPATVRVNAPLTQTAEWKVEYYLNVQSEYGNPSGTGWYREGNTATIKSDTAILVQSGKRVRFTSWFGTGTGSYTGPSNQKTITVDGPITETAQWKVQYALVLITEYGSPKPRPEGWYDDGTRVSFSVDTLVSQGSDTRVRFKSWQGVGAGSYTGEQNEAEVVITNSITEEAIWDSEYFLAVTVDPAGSGTVSPYPQGGGWGAASDTLELRAIGNVADGYGFSSWSGDANGTDNPLSLILDQPKRVTAHFKKGNVFITTDPPGLLITIQGREAVAPVVYDWLSGEQHRIGTITVQGDGVRSRYNFLDWSDGGSIEHDITVSPSTVRYTARFQESFFVKVESEFGAPSGQGWYNKGAAAIVAVDSVANVAADSRLRFKRWIGSGSGSVTSNTPSVQLTVTGPVTESADWEAQVKVRISVFPPGVSGGNAQVSPMLNWYALGTPLTLTAITGDPAHPFVKWTGNWSGNAASTSNPLSLLVNRSLDIRAWFWVQDDPPSISKIPDLILREDESKQYSFAWLGQYVSDPNDPVETLNIEFTGPRHIYFLVDYQKQELTVKPESHWNGTEQAVLTVSDQYGLSDADTFKIRVLPIEDAPQSFALIYPPDDTAITQWDSPIQFQWHKAVDPDDGETVQYSLILSSSALLKGSEDMRTTFKSDTTVLMAPPKRGTYFWGVIARDAKGNTAMCEKIFRLDNLTAVETERMVPLAYALDQNYPNPFNPETTIQFQLPQPGTVRIQIYDLNGRIVRTLEDRRFDAGSYKVRWDGLDDFGRQIASGVYVIRIQAGDFMKQRKMVLMR